LKLGTTFFAFRAFWIISRVVLTMAAPSRGRLGAARMGNVAGMAQRGKEKRRFKVQGSRFKVNGKRRAASLAAAASVLLTLNLEL
jgi:hypothetical protein